MPCNTKKDLTSCRAHVKMYPLSGRHFCTVYLWETREAMLAGAGKPSDSQAYAATPFQGWLEGVAVTGWWQRALCWFTCGRVAVGERRFVYPPKTCEMHFQAGQWDEEFVAHECLHATVGFVRAYQLEHALDGGGGLSEHMRGTWYEQFGGSDHEMMCYMHGELVFQVSRFLRRYDPEQVGKVALVEKGE